MLNHLRKITMNAQSFFITPKWETVYRHNYFDLGLEDDHYTWFYQKAIELGLNPDEHVTQRPLSKMGWDTMNCYITEDLYRALTPIR